jgi:hypothetical protein
MHERLVFAGKGMPLLGQKLSEQFFFTEDADS